jgi:uncharacterized membrane protein YkvA (DUF1232 family)
VSVPLRALPRFLFTGRFLQVAAYLPQFAKLYWRLFRHPRVSLVAKALLVLTGLYVIFPVDLVPDYLPVIGEIDDLAVVLGGLWLFVRLCPADVVRENVLQLSGEGRR